MNLPLFFKTRKLRQAAKEGAQLLARTLRYERDRLSASSLTTLTGLTKELRIAQKSPDPTAIQELLHQAERTAAKLLPSRPFPWLREQVEVIFVAVVVALALRAYFYQPFKIPTDSMKPTLYGIQSIADTTAQPALPFRVVDQLLFGRAYHHLTLRSDAQVVNLQGGMFTPWLEFTDLTFSNGETHRAWTNPKALGDQGVRRGNTYQAGQVVYHFHTDTGDQVFVNKWLYHFRLPERGEAFVFKTTGIAGIERSLRFQGVEGSQYYIKRCVGVPHDELQLRPPHLLVNGSSEHLPFPMQRVMSATAGYQGYGHAPESLPAYLGSPFNTLLLPANSYWAMGDNSYNSSDSRYWGVVPRANLVGTASCVWWPFGPRWGSIQ
jgi:signal peptidase I